MLALKSFKFNHLSLAPLCQFTSLKKQGFIGPGLPAEFDEIYKEFISDGEKDPSYEEALKPRWERKPPPGQKWGPPAYNKDDFFQLAGIQRHRLQRLQYVGWQRGPQTWHIFDAAAMQLGRLAQKAALILNGKHKVIPQQNPFESDQIVVVNCKTPRLLGKKGKNKIYRHHTGYPGGFKEWNLQLVLSKTYEMPVRRAIRGQLATNNLRRVYLMQRLHLFPDQFHNFDFLPQIMPPKPKSDEDWLQPPKPETGVVIWSNIPKEKWPEQFKDFKYEPDEEIELPPHERSTTQENLQKYETKAYKRFVKNYVRIKSRYLEWNYNEKKFTYY